MNVPQDLRYTKSHEWAKQAGGEVIIGITSHAQEELRDVVYVELPQAGKAVKQGEQAAVVESVKAAFSIYAPVSGAIGQVNEGLSKDPAAINRSPYEEGWIFSLQVANPEEAKSLMNHQQYDAWVKGGAGHPSTGSG